MARPPKKTRSIRQRMAGVFGRGDYTVEHLQKEYEQYAAERMAQSRAGIPRDQWVQRPGLKTMAAYASVMGALPTGEQDFYEFMGQYNTKELKKYGKKRAIEGWRAGEFENIPSETTTEDLILMAQDTDFAGNQQRSIKALQILNQQGNIEAIQAALGPRLPTQPPPSAPAPKTPTDIRQEHGEASHKHRITSPYGRRTHPVTGEKGKMHRGTDVAVPEGTPLYSPSSGEVTNVKTYKHAGKSITVVHDDDLTTTYHHLDTQDVTKGDIVEAGQQIGTSGNTGRSTGPHLHIEARKGGKRVDPESVPGLVEKVLTPLPARPTLSPEDVALEDLIVGRIEGTHGQDPMFKTGVEKEEYDRRMNKPVTEMNAAELKEGEIQGRGDAHQEVVKRELAEDKLLDELVDEAFAEDEASNLEKAQGLVTRDKELNLNVSPPKAEDPTPPGLEGTAFISEEERAEVDKLIKSLGIDEAVKPPPPDLEFEKALENIKSPAEIAEAAAEKKLLEDLGSDLEGKSEYLKKRKTDAHEKLTEEDTVDRLRREAEEAVARKEARKTPAEKMQDKIDAKIAEKKVEIAKRKADKAADLAAHKEAKKSMEASQNAEKKEAEMAKSQAERLTEKRLDQQVLKPKENRSRRQNFNSGLTTQFSSDPIFGRSPDATDTLANVKMQFIEIYGIRSCLSVGFKAYIKGYSDSFKSNWQRITPYGRMDPIHTFQNTVRQIVCEFAIPASSPEEAEQNMGKISSVIQMLYPTYNMAGRATSTQSERDPPSSAHSPYNTLKGPPYVKVAFMNWSQTAGINNQGSAKDTGIMGWLDGFTFRPEMAESGFFQGRDSAGNLTPVLHPKQITGAFTLNVIHEHKLGWAPGEDGAMIPRQKGFPYGLETSRMMDVRGDNLYGEEREGKAALNEVAAQQNAIIEGMP